MARFPEWSFNNQRYPRRENSFLLRPVIGLDRVRRFHWQRTWRLRTFHSSSDDAKNPTAEQIAEGAIRIWTGSRPVLDQIRRNGVERRRITRFATDGKTEESNLRAPFCRGEISRKIRFDSGQKLPSV